MNQATKTLFKIHLIINGLDFYVTIENSLKDDVAIEIDTQSSATQWAYALIKGFEENRAFANSKPRVLMSHDTFYAWRGLLMHWIQEEEYDFA